MPTQPSGGRIGSGPSTPANPIPRADTKVIGARIAAQVIDLVFQAVQFVVVTFLLVAIVGVDLQSGFFLATLTLPLYGGLLEGYNDGQTIGKAVVGIQVIDIDDRPCNPVQAFVRNLPAVLAPFGGSYLVALAAMASTDRRQRVFDHIAGTVVVRD